MTNKLINTFELTHVMQDNVKISVTVKVYRDTEWDEYVARLFVNGVEKKQAAYHDSDKDSCLHTAKCMVATSPQD